MQPRLQTSVKWTQLPKDFCEKVLSVLNEGFSEEAKAGRFYFEGRIYPAEVLVRIGYLKNERLRQMNFEASMDYSPQKMDATNKVYLCIDALSGLLEQYFEADAAGEEVDFPLQWMGFDFENNQVYLRHSTINTQLESEADRLLGLDSSHLVGESELTDDALDHSDVVDKELIELWREKQK